ncbi:hypothetical protein UFOVP1296_38 [uncultured Caudovirales phage]|uniref:Uncharacterized protein n=1 Tax=uncultured Caudovirales phage TaxID=2100421 RepID=A0A6J5RNR3_9CAUD|nr:hypothetical protein UFOVP471_56 [uncultured Caudovirales phage]CAB4169471.1 hypothetical protein UFOVP890_38 [uncultured Caudovirales phage]CAB4195826.1 hypothetical protein UFOVP1296_38 [uncultured Caudovirales phage]
MSLRDQILQCDDVQKEIIDVPQWNTKIAVHGMSGAARTQMIQNAADNDGVMNFAKMMPDIVIMCTFDPDTDEQVFSEADREALMLKSGAVLDLIVNTAMRISGLLEGAVDKAGKDFSNALADASSLS